MSKIVTTNAQINHTQALRPLSAAEFEQVGGAGKWVKHGNHHDYTFTIWGRKITIHFPL